MLFFGSLDISFRQCKGAAQLEGPWSWGVLPVRVLQAVSQKQHNENFIVIEDLKNLVIPAFVSDLLVDKIGLGNKSVRRLQRELRKTERSVKRK